MEDNMDDNMDDNITYIHTVLYCRHCNPRNMCKKSPNGNIVKSANTVVK